ncbi:hypothetical protein J2Z66_002100 [Paenibacillus eucommiae]|uniref:Uncharacterized protein n=1 Tax=Paenibacillus eucommiae TaxID=1355755 RepID=A0ABS4IVA9_9BACL|nr:hypothetical protein [Paenibacillus eucommiae]
MLASYGFQPLLKVVADASTLQPTTFPPQLQSHENQAPSSNGQSTRRFFLIGGDFLAVKGSWDEELRGPARRSYFNDVFHR